MKEYIITIDCGTTNTRAMLFNTKQQLIHAEKREVGVRTTAINGNNNQIKQTIRECIQNLLISANIGFADIKNIVATGMITSNMGLVEIPHLVAPVSLDELSTAIQTILLTDVCPIPISFVPGIKNMAVNIDLTNMENMDMMRGEEVESFAIINQLHQGKPMLLVLPGSHTKFVAVDNKGRIVGCLSSISGELLAAITQHTLIADAVNRSFVSADDYDREMLLEGYRHASKNGLSRTCFSTRILSQFVTNDKSKSANFLLGAVLQSDIAAVKSSDILKVDSDTNIVVAGKNPLRQALLDILHYENDFQYITEYQPNEYMSLSAAGVFVLIS